MMYAYMTWLATYVALPLAVLWMIRPRLAWEHKFTLLACAGVSLLVNVPLDWFAIPRGIWTFPPGSLVGAYFLGIPLEEYMFMCLLAMLVSTIALMLRELVYHRQRRV